MDAQWRSLTTCLHVNCLELLLRWYFIMVFYMQDRKLNLIGTPKNAIQPMIRVQIKVAQIRLKVAF
jgi:hypothetical protein